MGGMSSRWVVEAIKAQDWFEEQAEQVRPPSPLRLSTYLVFFGVAGPFSAKKLVRRTQEKKKNCIGGYGGIFCSSVPG